MKHLQRNSFVFALLLSLPIVLSGCAKRKSAEVPCTTGFESTCGSTVNRFPLEELDNCALFSDCGEEVGEPEAPMDNSRVEAPIVTPAPVSKPPLAAIYRFHIQRPNYLDHQFSPSPNTWVGDQKLDGLAFYVYSDAYPGCDVKLNACWGVTNHPGPNFGHTATIPGSCPPGYSLGTVLGFVCGVNQGNGSLPLHSLYSWKHGSDHLLTTSDQEAQKLRKDNEWVDWYGWNYWTPALY